MEPNFICCICNVETKGYGNNPEPVMVCIDENRNVNKCCDLCNTTKVIPARLGNIK